VSGSRSRDGQKVKLSWRISCVGKMKAYELKTVVARGEAPVSKWYSIKIERSQENANV